MVRAGCREHDDDERLGACAGPRPGCEDIAGGWGRRQGDGEQRRWAFGARCVRWAVYIDIMKKMVTNRLFAHQKRVDEKTALSAIEHCFCVSPQSPCKLLTWEMQRLELEIHCRVGGCVGSVPIKTREPDTALQNTR